MSSHTVLLTWNFEAWAHLILYGEEVTKKAQEEGEQAVAAYEQEQKDIAEGKIPVPASPKTKKKKPKGRQKGTASNRGKSKKKDDKNTKVCDEVNPVSFLKDTEPMYPKMSSDFQGIKMTIDKDDDALIMDVSSRILASRQKERNASSYYCLPVSKSMTVLPTGCAILLGLSSDNF